MHGEALINVCQAVIHGNERNVRNRVDGRKGRVIACIQAGFEVQVGENKESWRIEDCEDLE
jgi:hypothetical protein